MKKKFLLLSMALILSINTNVQASANTTRLGGKNRYETAALINNKMKSETLILATGNDFADSLSASSLVKHYNGEIHLVDKNLDSNTLYSLKNNEFTRAIIVGGTGVISSDIEEDLRLQLGIKNVERIGGKDRYETSELVSKKVLGLDNSISKAFVATGKDFADALSIAPISVRLGCPIILTPGDTIGELGISTLKTVDTYYKIGGTAVVSDSIDKLVNKEKSQVIRLGGLDRYETNEFVVNEFYETAFDYRDAYLASGLNFPDALVGSALAGKNSSPILLVGDTVHNATQDTFDLFSNCNLFILGGTGIISDKKINYLNENVGLSFKYKNKIVLPVEEGDIPTPDDISLIASLSLNVLFRF